MAEGELVRVRWILLSIFTLFCAIYVSTAFGRMDSLDAEIMFRVIESLVERGSLTITDEFFHVNQPYAVYGLGTSIFAMPFYVVGKFLGSDTRYAVSLFNPVITALTATMVYYFGLKLGFSPRIRLFLTFSLGLASLAWPYTKTFFSEPLIGFFLLSAAVAAYACRSGVESTPLAIVGFTLGAATLTREDTILVVPLFLAYLSWPGKQRPRIGPKETILVLAPLVALLAVTWWYHDLRFQGIVSGYVERTGNRFDWTPATLFTGIYGLLFSSGRGLVFYTPLVVLSAFSWRHFRSRYPLECYLFSALILERVVFFALLVNWFGGVGWGPRYTVPTLPLLILPIGCALASHEWTRPLRRLIIGFLFFVSLLTQLPGVAIFYARYWDATIGARKIIHDQMLFAPRWSPLTGQFHWMLEGRDVQWLLPISPPSLEWPVRLALLFIGLGAAGAIVLLHAPRFTRSSSQIKAIP